MRLSGIYPISRITFFQFRPIKLNDTITLSLLNERKKDCTMRDTGFRKKRARCVIRCGRMR